MISRRKLVTGGAALAVYNALGRKGSAQSFLPGQYPAGASAGAAPPVTAMSLFDSNTSEATTISVPAGVQAGDLLVLADLALSANVLPTDFTQIATDVVNTLRLSTSFKLATGSETTITGMSGSGAVSKILAVFRPNGTVASYGVFDAEQAATGGNPAGQTITSSGGTAPLIAFGFWGANGTVDPRAMTPAKDAELNQDWDSNTDALYIAWKFYDVGETPANVTVDMNDEGNANNMQSCYIQANAA